MPTKRGRGLGIARGRRERQRCPFPAASDPEPVTASERTGEAEAEVNASDNDSYDSSRVSVIASEKSKNMKVLTDSSPEEEQAMIEWLAHTTSFTHRSRKFK